MSNQDPVTQSDIDSANKGLKTARVMSAIPWLLMVAFLVALFVFLA